MGVAPVFSTRKHSGAHSSATRRMSARGRSFSHLCYAIAWQARRISYVVRVPACAACRKRCCPALTVIVAVPSGVFGCDSSCRCMGQGRCMGHGFYRYFTFACACAFIVMMVFADVQFVSMCTMMTRRVPSTRCVVRRAWFSALIEQGAHTAEPHPGTTVTATRGCVH